MVLSSQLPRPGMGRRHVYYRRRKSNLRRPVVFAVVLMVAVAVIYFVVQSAGGDGEPSPTNAGPNAAQGVGDGGHRVSHTSVGPGGGGDGQSSGAVDRSGGDSRSGASQGNPGQEDPAPGRQGEQATQGNVTEQAAVARQQARWEVAPADSNARTDRQTQREIQRGMSMLDEGFLVTGRQVLSQVLTREGRTLSYADANTIRIRLAEVNRELVFSKKVYPNDPLTSTYTLESGDMLQPIGRRYNVPWQFLARINGVDPRRIRAGQKLKVVRGPFHVEVYKSAHRLDVLAVTSDDVTIYICSYDVGLGAPDTPTPVGAFVVTEKNENPRYDKPDKGLHFAGFDVDPRNPVGPRWIGVMGATEATAQFEDYGIHGTVEPQSIGRNMSDGCIRLRNPEVLELYDMLSAFSGKRSTVLIKP